MHPRTPTQVDEGAGSGRGHPTPEMLAAFGLGRLAPTLAEQIERHVAECTSCWQALEAVPDDDFLHSLRTLPPPTHASATAAGGAGDTSPGPAGVPPGLADHPKYDVEEVLGAGGMGMVFRARHRLMNRTVALKVIHQRFVENPTAVERFRREVRAAAALSHPNVVTVHDADQAGDCHFLVMEYVQGVNLAEWVERHGPLPVPEACEYARQAAVGLQHACDHGLVHRDLKPHNLMRTPTGQVKILDFGLAGSVREALPADPASGAPPGGAATADTLTATNAVLGTPAYLAPEQAFNPRRVDIRADLYALGCTLYFLLAGRPPFPGGDVIAVALYHAETPPPLAELARRVPAGVLNVLERLLAKDPARRYQTPAEVAQALAPFSCAGKTNRWMRRAAVAAGVLAAVVGVSAIMAAWGGWGPKNERSRAGPPDAVAVEVRRLNCDGEGVLTAAVTADGRRVLTGNADNSLRLWDLESGAEVVRLGALTEGGVCAAVSPDGRLALAWGHPQFNDDGMLRLWDLANRHEVRHWEGHQGAIGQGVFTPDGRALLTGGRDHVARLWDVGSGRELQTLKGHDGRVLCVAVSPNGKRAATGGADRVIHLWDLQSGRKLHSLYGHAGNVQCVAFTPDGGGVVSGGYDTTVRLWDAETGRELRRMEGHNYLIESLSVSSDGKRVLAGDGPEVRGNVWVRGADHRVRLWDLATGRLVDDHLDHLPGTVGQVAFVPGGRLALWASPQDAALRVWRLPERAEPRPEGPGQVRRFEAPGVDILSIAFSPDGRRLLGGGTDHTLWRWEVDSGRELPLFQGSTGGETIWVTCAVFSPDGTRILSGESDGSVCMWEAGEEGKQLLHCQGHTEAVRAVAFAEGGRVGLSASGDHTVRIWDLEKGHETGRLLGHTDVVRALAVAPGGGRAWSGGQGGSVCLWDLKKTEKIRRWGRTGEAVHALAVSPDGTRLLGACGRVLRLWDAATGEERAVLPRDSAALGDKGVEGVAFTPDGRRALSVGSDDHQLRVWDLDSGAEVAAFRVNSVPRGVAVSPDGKWAACGGRGGASLWRLP